MRRCARLGAFSHHVFSLACGRASYECMRGNALFFMHARRSPRRVVRTTDETVIGEEGVGIFKAARRCADAN